MRDHAANLHAANLHAEGLGVVPGERFPDISRIAQPLERSLPMTASIDDHTDKYNDPRAGISRRGLWIAALVALFSILGAGFSIYARRTRLEQTTRFWGDDVITALQLAEEIELLASLDPDPESGKIPDPVRLSGMPGLGHLRHVLLDERSYDWETELAEPISTRRDDPAWMVLRLTDPTAKRFSEVNIALALDTGWVGIQGGQRQVQLNDRFRNAMPNFLKRIANYEPLRSEMREAEAAREQMEKDQP